MCLLKKAKVSTWLWHVRESSVMNFLPAKYKHLAIIHQIKKRSLCSCGHATLNQQISGGKLKQIKYQIFYMLFPVSTPYASLLYKTLNKSIFCILKISIVYKDNVEQPSYLWLWILQSGIWSDLFNKKHITLLSPRVFVLRDQHAAGFLYYFALHFV